MKSLIEKNVLKPYYYGLLFLAVLILGLQIFTHWYNKTYPPQFPNISFNATIHSHQNSKALITEFDPNELSAAQWKTLGFSDSQVNTILNYKKSLGGKFSSAEELSRCYAISEKKFNEIVPFINFKSEGNPERKMLKTGNTSKIKVNKKFDPNSFQHGDWVAIGFSEKQATSILKYKNYLGGKFKSKEDIKSCFVINDAAYNVLNPYLLLKEEPFKPTNQKINKNFDPNALDIEGWKSLGFSEKQAAVILNYKNKILKGNFKTKEDLKNCHVINKDKYDELLPYIKIVPSNQFSAPSNTKQETDFSKIDLNDITFKQLLEFGFEEKAAGSFIGFRKKLGGFATKDQILTTYNIDTELTKKLINTCPLDASKIQKYKLSEAPEEWLKNHPYFKYSADKIIFYRITYPDDRKIWKFLKLKPEYETRMRLYTINN